METLCLPTNSSAELNYTFKTPSMEGETAGTCCSRDVLSEKLWATDLPMHDHEPLDASYGARITAREVSVDRLFNCLCFLFHSYSFFIPFLGIIANTQAWLHRGRQGISPRLINRVRVRQQPVT